MSQGVERFEDLIAWQRARMIAQRVYMCTSREELGRDYGLKNQMRRAAVSIMSNIAEGFERGRASEFHQFLSVAKGSCAELRTQFYVALNAHYFDQDTFDDLMAGATELARIIGGLRAAVQRQRDLT